MSQISKLHWIDEQACPEWGTAPDNRRTRIAHDERLPSLFRDWQSDACDHEHIVTIRRDDSLGRAQYYEHCKACGLRLSSAVAHGKIGAVSDLTANDMDALADDYVSDRKARLEHITRQAAERCQGGNREVYDDYLRSETWKRRAAKIMQRADGVCEGCLTNPAEEVHHLTYEHLGAEFAWELRAVCGPCHRRLHKPQPA